MTETGREKTNTMKEEKEQLLVQVWVQGHQEGDRRGSGFMIYKQKPED